MATRPSAAVRPALLSERDRHLVSRFSFGLDEDLVATVRTTGSRAWFSSQLTPAAVPDPRGDALEAWWPRLAHTPQQAWGEVRADRASAWDYGLSLTEHALTRKIVTSRQVAEVMHDFWSNLLYVPAYEDRSFPWRHDYERTLRSLALTSFRRLLRAAVVHPAMSGWLTNDSNTKRGINENLGRELLELFTVGRPAGYGEEDVRNAARLLTGYRVKVFDTFEAFYSPADHWTGKVTVLGFTHANADPDGRAALAALLDHLALHPATARRIAHRLCVRFVGDDPPASLVAAVERAYRVSRSSVRTTLTALRTHPAFLASQRARLRTPIEDTVASLRAVGVQPSRPTSDASLARSLVWMTEEVGQHQYRWPRPDGFPESAATWTSPARMLASWQMHYAVAGNWWGAKDQVRPTAAQVLPTTFPLTLAELVEHQSRVLLGTSAHPATTATVATMLGRPATHSFRTVTDVDDWTLTVVRGTVLNAPEGMLR